MKRIIVAVLCAALLLLSFVVPSAKAMPSNTFNSYNGNSWAGNTHGGRSNVTVSNPGIHDSGGGWDRYLYGHGTNGDYAYVGMEKVGPSGSGSFCSSSANTLDFFYGSNVKGITCFGVNSGSINNLALLQFGWYTSNGGGTKFYIQDSAGFSVCYNGCNLAGGPQTFSDYGYNESINDTWTGHHVWGSEWINNQFQDATTGAWTYQNVPTSCGTSSGCPIPGPGAPPPQFYWKTYPGSNGGVVYSCDYDTGSTCTLGS